MIRHLRGLTSLKNATLQARMPAFQSHPPFAALPVHPPSVCYHENKKGVSKTTPLVTISLLRNANRLFFLEDNAVLRGPFKNQSDFKIKKREYVLTLLIRLDAKHIKSFVRRRLFGCRL
jgi:hypothetical protein